LVLEINEVLGCCGPSFLLEIFRAAKRLGVYHPTSDQEDKANKLMTLHQAS
jgi:hypothetical protein